MHIADHDSKQQLLTCNSSILFIIIITMVSSDMTSSAALVTLSVAKPILESDVLLHLVAQLASPLQLQLVVKPKGMELTMHPATANIILKESNAICWVLYSQSSHEQGRCGLKQEIRKGVIITSVTSSNQLASIWSEPVRNL